MIKIMPQQLKIIIATGIYPPAVGGPATYAKNLTEALRKAGNRVVVLSYKLEKKLPVGVRHCLYFCRLVASLFGADLIIALDIFSAGFPAVLAAKIFGKKIIVRVGGDFLWESYVNNTGEALTLKEFYAKAPQLDAKHRLISFFQGFVLRNCSVLVFNTQWQRDIFRREYGLEAKKIFVIENFYGPKLDSTFPDKKVFLWIGRENKLKNTELLKSAFAEVKKQNQQIELELSSNISFDAGQKKISECYAFVLPSLSDVGPNLILEAMQYNKPFILTRETGLFEKLKDIGIFVDPQNQEDIKNKILFLANDENYSEYKRRVADFKFTHSWQEIAQEFLDIYSRI
ncbi:MAG: Polysaccharide biosynthesis protein [Parcubacteria group bacterium GW2011_GWA2_42_11]|nr:MAG: Polysaccharide biosynthesis protein [Parcubacteria group bacterium GW2011_GWA2_42_11]